MAGRMESHVCAQIGVDLFTMGRGLLSSSSGSLISVEKKDLVMVKEEPKDSDWSLRGNDWISNNYYSISKGLSAQVRQF